MKTTAALTSLLLLASISGCAKPYVYKHPNHPEQYIASGFYSDDLLDIYGEGYKNFVENKIAGLSEYADVKSAWFEAQKVAIPKLLKAKGLIPQACLNGIEVTSTGLQEGMQVSANFVCRTR